MIKLALSVCAALALIGCSHQPPVFEQPPPSPSFVKTSTASIYGDVTITASGASTAQLLQGLADSYKLSINLASVSPASTVSVEFKDETLDRAVQQIARLNGLVGFVDYSSHAIVVVPRAQFQLKMEPRLSSRLVQVYAFNEYLKYKSETVKFSPGVILAEGTIADLDKLTSFVKSILGSDMANVELVIKG